MIAFAIALMSLLLLVYSLLILKDNRAKEVEAE